MPTPTAFPTGAPLWMDLQTSDPDRSQAFYESLFGWSGTSTGPDFGNYVNFALGGKGVGGMIENDGSSPDQWRVYLETDSAETTGQAITGAGGMVLSGPHEVGPLGAMIIAVDNDRAIIGAWQRAAHRGFEVVAEPGAPAWFELHTTSYEDAVQFYQQAFGWQTNTMSDTDEFRYTQLLVDGVPYAGIMDATAYWPAGDPAAWSVYVNVSDVDASAARAVELGGTLVDEPADTPFGRLATVADPTGVPLKIVGSMPQS